VNVAGGNVTGGNGGDGGTGGLGGSGILTKGANTLITIAASATVTGGLDGSGSGTNGLNEGVYLLGTDAILTNHGTIIGGANNNGDAIGVGRNTTSITNDGHLTAIGGAGVLVTDLSNTGTTDATLALLDNTNGHIDITNGVGVLVEPVSGTATSVSSITTLNNTAGSIATTGGFGVFIGCSSACDTTVPLRATIGNIINTGIISATTGDALYVQASGALTALHNTGGTITSANVGDFFGFAGATVVFDSTVQTAIHLNGTISNTAANNAAEALAIVATPAGTITNDGTIQSNGTGAALGVAVDLRAAATFDNASGGVVTGQVIDTGDVATTLTNEGHITGVVTIDGNALHTFTNTGALTGAVTIGGNTTNTINITGGSLSSTLTGGSGVDNLTLANGAIGGNTDLGAGANTMLVNGTFTTGGTFAATGGTIALTVASGGTLTVENTITTGAAALNVANGGILNVDGANLLNGGAFTNGGTTRIGAGRSLTAASYVAASAGTLTIGLTGDGVTNTAGLLQASTGASVINLSNTTLHIDVSGAGAIATGAGAAVAIARGGAGATELAADEPLAITDNSFFYDFSVAPGAGGAATDLLLTATAASIAGVVTDTNNVDVATVLLTGPLATSTDPQINAIQDKLAGDTTQAQFNADLQATEPTVDGGNIIAAVGATDASFDTVGEQLTALRTGDETGMSAGDQAHGLRGWIQGFGQHANQNERGGSPGYDANTWGGAIGFDSQGALENAVLGVSFGYGRTNADSKNSNSTNTDVDSYQLTLYGEQHVNKGMFVDGMASFGWDRNSETRHDIGGVTGLDAHADFNAWQGAARAEVGDDYNVTGGMTLTPTASVDYLHYDAQTFSETGAGGSDLVGVNFGNVDMLNLGVGVKAAWLFKNSDGSQVKPDVHAGYKYDVLSNDHVDATASFAAGGGTFTTNGLNPSNSTFDAGADIIFFSTSNWELKGSYDFTWKQDYTANSGHIRATYKF
jgi:outer membrane autotransporter protein